MMLMRPCAVATAMLLLLTAGVSLAEETSLIAFEVKDQFDDIHTEVELEGNIVLLFWVDRKGRDFNDDWVTAIDDSLQAEAAYGLMRTVEVAHTKGVPFFVKGKVKNSYSKEKDEWVLLDWKGKFNKAYDLESDSCNILVFDREGKLVHRAYGQELDQDVVAETLTAVRGLMRAAMEAPLESETAVPDQH